jgi:hypothetical protein
MTAGIAELRQAEALNADLFRTTIEQLSSTLNSPTAEAKNKLLQNELVKADKLFRKTIQKGITTLQSRLEFNTRFHNFLIEKIAPFANEMHKVSPETQAILKELFQENAKLTHQSKKNEDRFKKISNFIQLLSTQENPSSNEQSAFWNWADQLKD